MLKITKEFRENVIEEFKKFVENIPEDVDSISFTKGRHGNEIDLWYKIQENEEED